MALAAIIISTFVFPVIVFLLLWVWKKAVRKEIAQHNERNAELIKKMERIIALKNKLISLLKY
ncbi:MAG TPA: hypothetical protein VIM75_18175 [Ohtaekwangia sp.]|uniref:hypothetical protein n=1 Tax=Ohtaekwangia sp. TaxID=2066019 RepID=UPI002F92E176